MTGTFYTTNINLNNLIVCLCDGRSPVQRSATECVHVIERDQVQ